MAVMEPFFFFFNNLVFFLVLITTSVAVNLQFEKNEILTGDVKRSEDKKPEFTDVVTNQTVVAGRQEQYGKVAPLVKLCFSGRPSSPAMSPTWARTRWPG